MQLPEAFITSIRERFGTDAEAFLSALDWQSETSIRFHPHKRSEAFTQADVIPWHPEGRYLASRPVFALDPLWHGGAYYVQEASSMLLREVVRQSCADVLHKSLMAIDLCAAPGGKTTILLDELSADSLVVANEVIQSRVSVLAENLERWGHTNIAITSAEVERFAPLQGQFDLVLVDAPCSGEGMFRKDNNAASEWSPANVQLCASRQQRILTGAVPLIAPGGVLIYSTCTFNRAEDDDQIDWLIQQYGLEPIQIGLPATWGFSPTKHGHLALPHQVRGEGFYIAALRQPKGIAPNLVKQGGYKRLQKADKQQLALIQPWTKQLATEVYLTKSGMLRLLPNGCPVLSLLEQHFSFCLLGREIGELKGKDLIPAHAFSQSLDLGEVVSIELTLEQSLAFLRKQDLQIEAKPGWTLMRYQGIGLGWAKVLPNRVNNYLPMERRLRML